MENVAFIYGQTDDINAAVAITHYYLDYSHKDIEPIWLAKGDPIPWSEVNSNRRIFLIGDTPDPRDMKRLLGEAGDLIWIDNEGETIWDAYSEEPQSKKIKGCREDGTPLCELTWNSYFSWTGKVPLVIDMIAAYARHDSERQDWQTRVVPFMTAFTRLDRGAFDPDAFEKLWKVYVCIRRSDEVEREFGKNLIAQGGELIDGEQNNILR